MVFLASFTLSSAIAFAPLIDASFVHGMQNSLTLYYQNFEFNAGIYYVFREVGYWIKGYNTIAIIGKLFALFSAIAILAISIIAYLKKWLLVNAFLWISVVFALFSLILHPWYITLIILFSVFTNYRFGILWSLVIMGTYAGYSITGFNEVYWLVAFEFITVIGLAIYEMKQHQANLSATLNVAP